MNVKFVKINNVLYDQIVEMDVDGYHTVIMDVVAREQLYVEDIVVIQQQDISVQMINVLMMIIVLQIKN